MTHLHFDHCGGSVQWNKDKTGYEPAFKNAKFGAMKSNGQQNQIRERRLLSENILPMQESGQLNFIKRPEGDYLEQSELGFGIFLLMVILISR
jgi:glyoxylase-like metal-dependent hydrolase (beta-lactamase superfamily II)